MEALGGTEVKTHAWNAGRTPRAALFAALVSLAIGLPSLVRATTVTVQPPDTTVTVGDTFIVRAVTDAFPDLKAFELIYRYDPLRLQFLGAIAGEVLTDAGGYVDFTTPDAAPADSVIYDAAVLSGSTAGPGILVYLRFRALALGDALIQCELADFRDSQNRQTLPACEGSRVVITGPTPAIKTSWGKIKSLYR